MMCFLSDTNYPIQKIYGGIFDEYPLVGDELNIVKEQIDKLKNALNKRYNQMPQSTRDNIRMIEYIIRKFYGWVETNDLSNNMDSEIFLYSLVKQIDELKGILIEIDKNFDV